MPGFAGSVVLVAEQEPRLITVVIFWSGSDHRRYSQSIRRVRALVAPYADRNLRLQTMMAHLPVPRAAAAETNSHDAAFIGVEGSVREETICVA